jgi:transposase
MEFKKAYLTQEIVQFFDHDDDIESHTSSVNCIHCGERIWFYGGISDENSPATFKCPACDKIAINEMKIYSLYQAIH